MAEAVSRPIVPALVWLTQNAGLRSCIRVQGILSGESPSKFSSATTIFTSRSVCALRGYLHRQRSAPNDELDKLRMSATASLFERRGRWMSPRCPDLTAWSPESIRRHAGHAGQGGIRALARSTFAQVRSIVKGRAQAMIAARGRSASAAYDSKNTI